MGGWVGRYLLFIYLHFIFTNWAIFLVNFLGCPKICPMWLVKNTINEIGCVQIDLSSMTKWSNWPNVKMISFWFSFPIKQTMISCNEMESSSKIDLKDVSWWMSIKDTYRFGALVTSKLQKKRCMFLVARWRLFRATRKHD